MASSRPVIWTALVRPAIDNSGSWRPARAAFILPMPWAIEMSRGLVVPKGLGRSVSSMLMPAMPAVSSSSTVRFTESALPAVVGIDHQRQVTGAVDAIGLVRELAQGEHDQVGGAQHHHRGNGAREHAEFEADVLGDARGDRVVDRAGMDATAAVQDGAEARATVGPVHG